MRTEHAGQAQKRRRGKRASSAGDAIAMLKKDHKEVQDMFRQFEKMAGNGDHGDKAELVSRICNALKAHTELEEEIFYPAVRGAIEDDLLMDEALVEHDNAKHAIQQLESMQPGDERYDAMVCVLGEEVRHHIQEEEKKIMPAAKKAKVDMAALGEEMQGRKKELMASGDMSMSA
jgi:hemerythrin-like domain-containing protein